MTGLRWSRPWPWGLAVLGGLAGGWLMLPRPWVRVEPAPVVVVTPATVTALGYLEPASRVIQLTPPTPSDGGQNSRIASLRVEEGDWVTQGQVIAVLDSQARLQAAYQEAAANLALAQANLAQVLAGAKPGEIQAQKERIQRLIAQRETERAAQMATVNRLQAEVDFATTERNRYRQLFREGAESQSLLDSKELNLKAVQNQLAEAQANLTRIERTVQKQIHEAQATLAQIQEVRSVDVQTAQAEIQIRQSALHKAQVNLEQTRLRAPFAGQILTVYTRPGEVVGTNGVVALGQTQKMTAVLEVYETEIRKVKLGQTVRLFADSINEPLWGKVTQIGVIIQRQNVINSDPSENIDSRVVEVRVELAPQSSQQVAGQTNLQITGEIQP
ncbi:HlyD family efflux transporter periplasmic adaptor subunit [Gloeomargarita lithophora]|nr:HlyD family efflux transporter periplasmic adaptor subunit [Gloeomargarita lithophora]